MSHIKRMTDKPRSLPWRAQVKRKGHLTLVKMFLTRDQAQRWANAQESSILEAGLPLTIKHLERHTVGDIVSRYLKEMTPQKGCHVSEGAVLNAFLRRDICRKSLARVKRQDAYAYVDARLNETWRGRNITPRTVRREVNSIQHIFETAKERWGFENLVNPFGGLPIKGSSYARKRRLMPGEQKKLDDACKKCRGLNQYYVPLAIYLACETGMRLQEMFNLTWQDIDFEQHEIEIRKSKTDHISLHAGRTIASSFYAELFLMHLYIKLHHEGAWKPEQRIFPMNKNAFKQTWSDVCDRAGITDLTFHDLRREAGSRFHEAGLTKPEHDLMMGHATRDMMSLYIRSDLKIIRTKLEKYALKGRTIDETVKEIEADGIPMETIILYRSFNEAAKRDLSSDQAMANYERAIRRLKSEKPDVSATKVRVRIPSWVSGSLQ